MFTILAYVKKLWVTIKQKYQGIWRMRTGLSDREVEIGQQARPPRFVYLVEDCEDISEILDKIFKGSL